MKILPFPHQSPPSIPCLQRLFQNVLLLPGPLRRRLRRLRGRTGLCNMDDEASKNWVNSKPLYIYIGCARFNQVIPWFMIIFRLMFPYRIGSDTSMDRENGDSTIQQRWGCSTHFKRISWMTSALDVHSNAVRRSIVLANTNQSNGEHPRSS
jgi:hypothetical protein